MRAIRAEHSRLRSIVRKRMERMEKAGETDNESYRRFGDREKQLPRTDTLSDRKVLQMLGKLAQQVGAGYNATLTQVKQSKLDWQQTMKDEVLHSGDEELAESLNDPLTQEQFEQVARIMGMLQSILGRKYDSTEILVSATKAVLRKERENVTVRTMGIAALKDMGILEKQPEMKKFVQQNYGYKGRKKEASYTKSHKKRGK